MTTATSTTIDAAICAISCRRCDYDDPISDSDCDALHRAITAHVEAEVARRLAVAPGVEEAIDAMAEDIASSDEHVPIFGHDGIGRDRLRTAIAADRARAVAEACSFAAAICKRVGARETGIGGQTIEAGEARLYSDAAKRIDQMIARDKARPTPDEARRLVDEFDRSTRLAELASAGGGISYNAHTSRQIAARAALLRALGVEA
jgi:hypothetical protein